jgi:IMP dehydrogenase
MIVPEYSRVSAETALGFDDVRLVPASSSLLSADARLQTQFSQNIPLSIPIISAGMNSITGHAMAIALARLGGIGVLHRAMSPGDQAEAVKHVKSSHDGARVAAAVGTGDAHYDRIDLLLDAGVDALVVDAPHGHSKAVLDTITHIRRQRSGTVDVVAGNIATAAAVHALVDAGANGIKVGVGVGSLCTTTSVAGVGVPQFSAIMDVANACSVFNIPLIADGGIRHSGDAAKALAAGAFGVMVGGLLAGTDETPGAIVEHNGEKAKEYKGMGFTGAVNAGAGDPFGYSKKTDGHFLSEGTDRVVPLQGPVTPVIEKILDGIRAAMLYTGCADLAALRTQARFIRVTR